MLDKGVRVAIYCYVYEHYKLVSLPWDSMLTWAVAALAVDFFYYWAHRAVHGDTCYFLPSTLSILSRLSAISKLALFATQKSTYSGLGIKSTTVLKTIT